MGFFDFLKRKSLANTANAILPNQPEKSTESFSEIVNSKESLPARNFLKDKAGLYPYEILLLSYAEQYLKGKTIAKFWKTQYGVDDVLQSINSLEQRGFIENGSLTDLGQKEIELNQYVLYMHRHKNLEVSMTDMSILVNKHPKSKFRDLLWGEFNRLSLQHMKNRQYGWYCKTRQCMHDFLLEENKYEQAFPLLAEAVFYDLNGSTYPSIDKATVEKLCKIEQKLNYTDEKIIEILRDYFSDIYNPYKNFSNDEVTLIVAAICMGHDEMAFAVLNRYYKKTAKQRGV